MFHEIKIITQILSPSILISGVLCYYNLNNANVKNTILTKNEQMLLNFYCSSV